MGYVAVRGGGKAIEESLKLLEYQRVSASSAWGTDEIEGTFPELVDQVMGEASLYAPRLAALALKQAQGSPDEAVFLLRAFRSTLERPYVSRPVDTGAMRVNRRVSAAFKDVPGGQVLGATRDYSHRLLAFDLETEGAEELAEKRAELAAHFEKVAEALEAAPDVAPAASPCAEIPVGAGCCPPAGATQGTPTEVSRTPPCPARPKLPPPFRACWTTCAPKACSRTSKPTTRRRWTPPWRRSRPGTALRAIADARARHDAGRRGAGVRRHPRLRPCASHGGRASLRSRGRGR